MVGKSTFKNNIYSSLYGTNSIMDITSQLVAFEVDLKFEQFYNNKGVYGGAILFYQKKNWANNSSFPKLSI